MIIGLIQCYIAKYVQLTVYMFTSSKKYVSAAESVTDNNKAALVMQRAYYYYFLITMNKYYHPRSPPHSTEAAKWLNSKNHRANEGLRASAPNILVACRSFPLLPVFRQSKRHVFPAQSLQTSSPTSTSPTPSPSKQF